MIRRIGRILFLVAILVERRSGGTAGFPGNPTQSRRYPAVDLALLMATLQPS